MRTTILSGMFLLGMAAAAAAQESPGVLTRDERNCEAAMVSAVGGYAADIGDCLADCEEAANGDPYACTDYGPRFLETRQCLDMAHARAEVGVARECGGAACVDCYGDGQCRTFRDTQLGNVLSFASMAMTQLYCNDGFSADGLTTAERRCRTSLVTSGSAFVSGLGQCFQRCHRRARARGRSELACSSSLLDTEAMDPSTQRCVARMRERFRSSCERRCGDAPDCFPFSCNDAVALTEAEVRLFEPQVLCADVPRCGDGYVTEGEVCDPGSYEASQGCGFYPNQCTASCTCGVAEVCGDGYVSGSEECEPYGFGGCGAGEVCSGCRCEAAPDRCGAAVDVPAAGGHVQGVASGPSATSSVFCGGQGPEAVLRWTPEASGTATLTTCGSSFDTVLSVRAGECASGPEITCNDDSYGACSYSASSIELAVTAGQTYWIFVDSFWAGSGGSFVLEVTPPASSPSGAFLP